MLIIGLVIQFILSAVLPTTPGLQTMQQGTSQFLSYFYVPNFSAASSNPTSQIIILWYKLFATVLTVAMIYATVMDLKGEKVSLIAVIIITVIFGLPFAFLAYLWLPFCIPTNSDIDNGGLFLRVISDDSRSSNIIFLYFDE